MMSDEAETPLAPLWKKVCSVIYKSLLFDFFPAFCVLHALMNK